MTFGSAIVSGVDTEEPPVWTLPGQWYDDFDRDASCTWGEPDAYPPDGTMLDQYNDGDTVQAGVWLPQVKDGPTFCDLTYVTGGTAYQTFDPEGFNWQQGIVFAEQFTFPLEVLWTGLRVTTDGHPEEISFQGYILSTWGINSVAFTPWVAFSAYHYSGQTWLYISQGNWGIPYDWCDDSTAEIDLGSDPSVIADRLLMFRWRIDASGVHANLWPAETAEPAGWQVTAPLLVPLGDLPSVTTFRGISIESDVSAPGGPPFYSAGTLSVERVDILEGYVG